MTKRLVIIPAVMMLLGICGIVVAVAQDWKAPRWTAQSIHVPVYSHVYYGNKEHPFALAVTLSVRNSSAHEPIMLDEVRYVGTQGETLRAFASNGIVVPPLSGVRFVVAENDLSGGSGARFVVRWHSEQPVFSPIIEGVMIGTASSQGISFVTQPVVLEGRREP